MPGIVVFHEGNTLALNGLANDDRGLAALFSLCHSIVDSLKIVTVDNLSKPTEGAELLIVGSGIHNLGNMTVNTMVADVKAYFMSLGAGDGYPYDIDAKSVRDIKINNSIIFILSYLRRAL